MSAIKSEHRVDPNDERLLQVEEEYANDLNDLNTAYSDRIAKADSFYEEQGKALDEYSNVQQDLQNQQTDLSIQQINQQKEQAEKDYAKEQSAAYVDYQKQTDKYGVNAEKMAANGLQNSGYSESSQVSMYNAYQNRVSVAREAISKVKAEYDTAIAAAKLQNSVALAQIAAETMQKKLELALSGFQYKNTLLDQQETRQLTLKQMRQSNYKDVLDQINSENALEENARQFNEEMAFAREQAGMDEEANLEATKTALTQKISSETFKNADQVRSFLNENGISAAGIEIKTRAEWRAAKKNNEGDGAYNYENYKAYLKSVVEYAISELT